MASDPVPLVGRFVVVTLKLTSAIDGTARPVRTYRGALSRVVEPFDRRRTTLVLDGGNYVSYNDHGGFFASWDVEATEDDDD